MVYKHVSSKIITCVLVLAILAAPSYAALMAIDLGSEFLKISVIKPGRIPISIVPNEMSKRKSPSAVAFINGDRLVGDEAAALSIRYPERVYTRLRDLLGRNHDDPEISRLFKDSRLAYSVIQAPNRTTIAIKTDKGEIYSAEELAASLLEYAKSLASAAADGLIVTDCVLAIPAYYGPAQRQALLNAAELAGLNVLSMVHAHAAAALQYGIERDFTNKTEDVLFYDLGNSAAQAALVRFSSFPDADGKQPAISQLEVKDVAWVEHGVGSDAIEHALLEYVAAQHVGGAEEVLSSPRAVAKLRKQIKRTKEILSANTEAPISVEELLPGIDFKGRVTREQLEEAARSVWDRAVAPVKEILKRNNLTGHELHAVELLGGSSRVPKVKSMLMDVLGGRSLDMHIDADEATVLGAGLVAANLSTIFRLRKFGLTDKTPYQVSFTLEGAVEGDGTADTTTDSSASAAASTATTMDGEQQGRILVPAMKKMPTRRAIALHNVTSDGFSVQFMAENSDGAVLPCCRYKEVIGSLNVSGISGVVKKYGHSGKVAVHTVVDQSGVFKVDKIDAAVEVIEEVPVVVPKMEKNTTDSTVPVNTTSTTNSTDEATASSSAEQHDSTKVVDTDGGDAETKTTTPKTTTASAKNNDSIPANTETEAPQQTKTVKRTLRIPLEFTGGLSYTGLTEPELRQSKRTLRTLRERDYVKRDTAKARNDLESYVISMRDDIEDKDDLKAVSTEKQREDLVKALGDAEEWLYGDGDSATGTEYREKLRKLKKMGSEIENRATEAVTRPQSIKAAKAFVELTLKTANMWPTIKPWLNETDVETFKKTVEEFTKWLDESIGKQEKKAPHEEPVFRSNEVARRIDVLRSSFSRLNTKTKPIEKKKPIVKDDTTDTEKNNTTIPDKNTTDTADVKNDGGQNTTASSPEKEEKKEKHDEL